jgi:hypothetical protein
MDGGMNLIDIAERAGIGYFENDILNTAWNSTGKEAIQEYGNLVIQECINHLESKVKEGWQINYHGGWKGAIEELKELQRLK